ncbi:ABC transporter substrate-binding protein [Paenibacillus hodogayensis]|uniref:ABC transporter substrate-binding protein n=1 Tax=Paenibacillus hodogayensis TaxID=279208 RepID=A0ABV5W6V8_9BACL
MKKWVISAVVGTVLVAAGCSGADKKSAETESQTVPKAASEPVTLKAQFVWLSDEEFDRYVETPVKKKYPHISFERLKIAPHEEKKLEEMVASGTYPDLIFTSSQVMDPLVAMGFTHDIEPLIKKHGLDLGRFENGSMDTIKLVSGGSYIAGIPYNSNFSALYYNKDIFDKFGTAYPKDGMTWNDAIELAKKVTRSEGGIQYSGLHADGIFRPATQLSLQYIDPATKKAVVNNDGWKKVLEMYRDVFTIPGNEFVLGAKAWESFTKDRTRAMYAHSNRIPLLQQIPDLNWDMVGYPTFKDAPGKGQLYDMHVAVVTAQSKNKDAAFQVIQVLTSDEVQTELSKNGTKSILKDPNIRKVFGEQLPFAKSKNIQAAFQTTPTNPVPVTKWDYLANNYITAETTKKVILEGVDINTALRDAEEKINNLVLQQGGK